MRTVGVVTALARKYTKKGDLMAVFVLEDLQAAIEVMVFPRTMLEYGPMLADDAVVCVKGRLDTREEPPKIVCLEVDHRRAGRTTAPPLRIDRAPARLDERKVAELKGVLLEHPGDSPVFLHSGSRSSACPTSSASTPATAWPASCGSCCGAGLPSRLTGSLTGSRAVAFAQRTGLDPVD